jgi:hypothetical protein
MDGASLAHASGRRAGTTTQRLAEWLAFVTGVRPALLPDRATGRAKRGFTPSSACGSHWAGERVRWLRFARSSFVGCGRFRTTAVPHLRECRASGSDGRSQDDRRGARHSRPISPPTTRACSTCYGGSVSSWTARILALTNESAE